MGRNAAPPPLSVNCLDQVRVWISSDGLPTKHRVRLARLRAMDRDARVRLVVARKWLEPAAAKALAAFAARLDIEVVDMAAIAPVDTDEATILEHVHSEI